MAKDTIKGFSARLSFRSEKGFMGDYNIGRLTGCTPLKAKSAMLSAVRTLISFLIAAGYEEDLDRIIAEIKVGGPEHLAKHIIQG